MEMEDFVSDDIHKTLLNEHRLIGIGSEVVYYHRLNQWVKLNKNETEAIEDLARIDDAETLFDPEIEFVRKKPILIHSPLISIAPLKGEFIWGDFRFTSQPIFQNVNCSIYEKLLLVEIDKYEAQNNPNDPWVEIFPWAWPSPTLTIDWGDGTSQVINDYDGEFVSHTYSSLGTFSPSTVVTWTEGIGVNQVVIELVDNTPATINDYLVAYACTQQEDARWGEKTSGNWKMTTKLWHTINMFGTHVGSRTWAWKKQSDGSWKLEKADIYAKVHGTFRSESCTNAQTETGIEHHVNDKKVQKTKSKVFKALDYYNNDVNSVHWLQKNGVYMDMTLFLAPC